MSKNNQITFSVPIWGLFNLTKSLKIAKSTYKVVEFPSPSGDYLI